MSELNIKSAVFCSKALLFELSVNEILAPASVLVNVATVFVVPELKLEPPVTSIPPALILIPEDKF